MTTAHERDTSQDKAIITITNNGKVMLTFDPSASPDEKSFRGYMGMVGLLEIQKECERRSLTRKSHE